MAERLPEYSYKGVKFTFTDTSVRVLEELKCPICLELLSEPFVTTCHHLFCKDCIEHHITCPTCRKQSITTIPDVGSARVLKAFKVKCPNSMEGCKWQGDLGDAEEHLMKKCQHQKVECPNECGKVMVGPIEVVVSSHLVTCDKFLLDCPGCGEEIERKDMENHLATECSGELVPCKYVMFGCDEEVERSEKDDHFDDLAVHLEKCMESQVTLLQLFSNCIRTKSWNSADVTSLPLSFRPWLQNTPTCYPRPPWVVKLEAFEEKRNEEEWYSDPVYSHFGGYKMCLRIDPNGEGVGQGTHVSVFAYLMKGDNDDNLKFAFKGRIVVSLLNQLEDRNHHTMELWNPDSNVPETSSGRVTIGVRSVLGWGIHKFIPYNDLNYNSYKNCQYLKDDCLFFRVDKFECVF